jgi:hypothetical protein
LPVFAILAADDLDLDRHDFGGGLDVGHDGVRALALPAEREHRGFRVLGALLVEEPRVADLAAGVRPFGNLELDAKLGDALLVDAELGRDRLGHEVSFDQCRHVLVPCWLVNES